MTSFQTRARKLATAVAMVGLMGGATAAPAMAGDHNSGQGAKVGHDNGSGAANGHVKQDGPQDPTYEELCIAAGGDYSLENSWISYIDENGDYQYIYVDYCTVQF